MERAGQQELDRLIVGFHAPHDSHATHLSVPHIYLSIYQDSKSGLWQKLHGELNAAGDWEG